MSSPARDRELVESVSQWFAHSGRDLPWRRGGRRDPYRSLVSEIMLQQTQADRVAERFVTFVERFPTVLDLARASEDEVLALWSGLGYYARARRLRECARAIIEHHRGRIPGDVQTLRTLPGVGAYTAGAIASIVFGRCEPIVDGNVSRVLMRVHARPGTAAGERSWAWERSAELVRLAARPGVFNEGLMELGATVCTPKAPACGVCPVRSRCAARRLSAQGKIPGAKVRGLRGELHCASVVVTDARGRVLVEQRSPGGLWPGLWQAPTLERADRAPTTRELRERYGFVRLRHRASFEHATTHRAVRFAVFTGQAPPRRPPGTRWVSGRSLSRLGMSSAQARVLAAVGEG